MKPNRVFVLVSAVLVIASSSAAEGVSLIAKKEPTFEDKTISFWLDSLPFISIDDRGGHVGKGFPEMYENLEQAEAHQRSIERFRRLAPSVVEKIGTNAIPYVIERLKTPDLAGKYDRQFANDESTGIKREVSARVMRGQAIVALEILKAHKSNFEQALVAIAKDRKVSAPVRSAAVGALKTVVPEQGEKCEELLTL